MKLSIKISSKIKFCKMSLRSLVLILLATSQFTRGALVHESRSMTSRNSGSLDTRRGDQFAYKVDAGEVEFEDKDLHFEVKLLDENDFEDLGKMESAQEAETPKNEEMTGFIAPPETLDNILRKEYSTMKEEPVAPETQILDQTYLPVLEAPVVQRRAQGTHTGVFEPKLLEVEEEVSEKAPEEDSFSVLTFIVETVKGFLGLFSYLFWSPEFQ